MNEGDVMAAERKKMLSWQLSDLLRVLWSGKILMATPHRLLSAVYTQVKNDGVFFPKT